MSNTKKTNPSQEQTPPPRKEGIRETVESIVIAFVFAFLFRTFEAEAFVIPTGSMAPTLFGRHKDVDCESCGYHFHVGASVEMDSHSQQFDTSARIEYAYCPNCRYKNNVKDIQAFTGDRILVNKFPYEIGDPKRWDVPVFKFPENPGTNYIKRLVGMPGETIRIRQGNVYAKKNDKTGWNILRKENPNKQNAIQILVFDNDHRPVKLHQQGLPECWAAVVKKETNRSIAGWSKDENGWKPHLEHKAFRLNAMQTEDGKLRWLRYRHYVPTVSDWNSIQHDKLFQAKPRLVTDFCGYNGYKLENLSHRKATSFDEGVFWNGELTLSATFNFSQTKQGELLLELNQASRKYRCRFQLDTGVATLSYETGLSRDGEDEKILASAPTTVKGVCTRQITFANVDNRLCLWVDGTLIDFGKGKGEYQSDGALDVQLPVEDDLIPVGIAAKGVDVAVSHLVLRRDIYYRASFLDPNYEFVPDSNERRFIKEYGDVESPYHLIQMQTNPEEYGSSYHLGTLWNNPPHGITESAYELTLGEDEYLMLGDNSPASSDSRLWSNTRKAKHRYAVPREAFVGKAFYIYWPHGIPFGNGGKGYALFNHPKGSPEEKSYPSTSVPFYPNFKRMKRIR